MAKGLYIGSLCIFLIICIYLVLVYPVRFSTYRVWAVFAVIAVLMVREDVLRRLMMLYARGAVSRKKYFLFSAAVQFAAVIAAWFTFRNNTSSIETGYWLLAAFALTGLAAGYSHIRGISHIHHSSDESTPSACDIAKTHEKLRSVESYRRFAFVTITITAACVITLACLYTFFITAAMNHAVNGNGALSIVIIMAVACVCTAAAYEGAQIYFRLREKKQRSSAAPKTADMTNLLLVGMIMWLSGVMMLSKIIRHLYQGTVMLYVSLGIVTFGACVCIIWLSRMRGAMAEVTEFATGEPDGGKFTIIHSRITRTGIMAGEMVSLVCLTLLTAFTTPGENTAEFLTTFHPVMVLPAASAVAVSLLCALRLPLNRKYMEKLARFLNMTRSGITNTSLQKQLEAVVVQKHTQPFLVRGLMAVVRRVMGHKVKDRENITPDWDNPIVFLCNHGEMYGPVTAMAYIPVDVRPWVMSQLTLDKKEMTEYFYKWTMSQQKWLLPPLRHAAAAMLAPVCVWGMNQLECIPVYRDKPKELIKTFRMSVEAMQAGDNMLIFPENPNAKGEGSGYEKSGVGELFSGFAMLAPIYYSRTGKRVRFLPMFCHKEARTVSFGHEIVYNPDSDPMEERNRLVEEAHSQMVSLSQREDRLLAEKNAAKKIRGRKK